MNRNDEIRAAQNRVIEKLIARPDKRFTTSVTKAHIGEGLVCTATQDEHRVVMDLGRPMGGDGTGPSPSFFARAAIAGCVAICIKMTAAREGIVLKKVDVNVETDHDNSAIFGNGANAAPLETRLAIAVESDLSERDLRALVDYALEMDIWYLALRDAQTVKTSIRTTSRPQRS